MIQGVRFHPLAIRELARAFREYRQVSPALGRDFLEEVTRILRLVRSFPKIAAILQSPHRRYPLSRFPYHVIYEVLEDDTVFVVAVAHRRRDPEFWSNRGR